MGTALSAEELLDRITAAGIPGGAAAQGAVRALLVTLGERLTDDEADALAAHLPREMARILHESEYDGDFDAGELYERVGRRESTSPSVAHEHADMRRRLGRVLPDPIGSRLEPPHHGLPPPHVPGSGAVPLSTLAHGRPGSRHPISESAPPLGQSSSVVKSDDPHGETKLSSGRGLTQERLRETLATGRSPQPAHPICETDDGEEEP